jgi:fluoroacetyl-CoA thioesterase
MEVVFMRKVPIGARGTKTVKVTRNTLASFTGSGAVDVFSTPNLVLLMEEACVEALRDYLEEGETTVGTFVNVKHLTATPPGLQVTATGILTQVEGRKLVFQVMAYDDVEKVGEGTHERFLVNRERFTAKSLRKKDIHKE